MMALAFADDARLFPLGPMRPTRAGLGWEWGLIERRAHHLVDAGFSATAQRVRRAEQVEAAVAGDGVSAVDGCNGQAECEDPLRAIGPDAAI